MKKLFIWLFILSIVVAIGLVGMYQLDKYMTRQATLDIYTKSAKVPAKKAALLLGTGKYIHGKENYFYTYRIRAAAALFKSGKIKAIVISGDNAHKSHDEPTDMKKDLIKAGVPKQYITLDYAGFRTLDSIVRAKAIFDLEDYIIISQRFHLERALYIAKAKGQQAIGFAAKDLSYTLAAKKMKLREYLARTKAFLDIAIFHTEPKFYGKKEKVTYKP